MFLKYFFVLLKVQGYLKYTLVQFRNTPLNETILRRRS